MSKKKEKDSDLPETQPEGLHMPSVDPDQVETHHLNPSELPAWVLAKLPESLTVDTSKFQEPNVAYAIRFAIGRGAKEGDIVHFCAGV